MIGSEVIAMQIGKLEEGGFFKGVEFSVYFDKPWTKGNIMYIGIYIHFLVLLSLLGCATHRRKWLAMYS